MGNERSKYEKNEPQLLIVQGPTITQFSSVALESMAANGSKLIGGAVAGGTTLLHRGPRGALEGVPDRNPVPPPFLSHLADTYRGEVSIHGRTIMLTKVERVSSFQQISANFFFLSALFCRLRIFRFSVAFRCLKKKKKTMRSGLQSFFSGVHPARVQRDCPTCSRRVCTKSSPTRKRESSFILECRHKRLHLSGEHGFLLLIFANHSAKQLPLFLSFFLSFFFFPFLFFSIHEMLRRREGWMEDVVKLTSAEPRNV